MTRRWSLPTSVGYRAAMTARRGHWTVMEVLDWTRGHFADKGVESPRLDAEVLLAHVLSTQRVMLYAQFDRPMEPEELATMRGLVARRAAGAPVAHLVGRREFWSLEVEVGPDVLVPRPETEILIEVARRRGSAAERVVDVGTGSGAIAIALAVELPAARIWGLERSEAALEVARRNRARLLSEGAEERLVLAASDLLDGLPADARPVDLLVANLPYVPRDVIETLAPEVRAHEPHLALDGGPDGLALLRRLIAQAPEALAPGGTIALESAPDQPPAITALLRDVGFEDVEITPDLAGHPRVTSARKPA